MRQCVLLLLGGLVVLLCGCNPRGPRDTPNPTLSSTPLSPTPDSLLEPDKTPILSPDDDRQQRLDQLQGILDRAVEDFPGEAGVAYFDLELGAALVAGKQDAFEAASMIKIPIMVELYRRFEVGALKPTEKLVLEKRFVVGGSGVLKERPLGESIELQELARLMITKSDNIATDMLLDKLGMEKIEGQMSLLGLEHTKIRRGIYDFAKIDQGLDNLSSPNDIRRLLQGIAQHRLPGSEAMHGLLEQQERRDMMPALLPKGTKVAHKTGELLGILHDGGIVYSPSGAYVLVMMSQGVNDPEAGVAAWAGLSKTLFDLHGLPQSSPTP